MLRWLVFAEKVNICLGLNRNGAEIICRPLSQADIEAIGCPRYLGTAYRLDISLRQRTADDFSTVPIQTETNVHFLGKYQPTQHSLLRLLWQNSPLDQP